MEHFAHGAISPTVKIAATAKDIKENGGPAIVHPLFPVEPAPQVVNQTLKWRQGKMDQLLKHTRHRVTVALVS